MARTIDVASQAYPPGNYGPFEITNLNNSDEGFLLTFTREAWPEGQVATVFIEITDDGVTWKPWITQQLDGGVVIGRDGSPVLLASISGLWPGENDGSGGRRKKRQTNVRFSATVVQTFTTAIHMEPV